MNRLWVYGASNCLPWRLAHEEQCWTNILASRLDLELINRSREGCDNLYLYHSISQDLPAYDLDDIVIVAWTHPNRKTWVLDRSNPRHNEQVDRGALVYPGDPTFFRSDNKTSASGLKQWLTLAPMATGNRFFDTWFSDYHSEHEQRLNFGAYHTSAETKIPCRKFFLYFSQESVKNVINDDVLCYLEFVLDTKTQIDQEDLHCDVRGHAILADLIWQNLTHGDQQSK